MNASVDLTAAATTAAELIDVLGQQLEEHDAVRAETVEVGVVGIVVEVNYEGEDGEEYTVLQWRCSDPRKWVQFGLFQRVADSMRTAMDTGEST